MALVHEVEWTPELVGRFWDARSTQTALQALYFSRMRGDAILDAAQRYVNLKAQVVDLGAGIGYLTEKLLARGAHVAAVDFSAKSVEALEAKMRNRPNFRGARVSTIEHVPLPDRSTDIVFSIETVEHLDDTALGYLLAEAKRLLKPGGSLVITTPNQEDLELAQVICPSCLSMFHPMQHIRSWSSRTLQDAVAAFGFQTRVCKPTVFSRLPRILRPLNALPYLMTGTPAPHLLYIGTRSQDDW